MAYVTGHVRKCNGTKVGQTQKLQFVKGGFTLKIWTTEDPNDSTDKGYFHSAPDGNLQMGTYEVYINRPAGCGTCCPGVPATVQVTVVGGTVDVGDLKRTCLKDGSPDPTCDRAQAQGGLGTLLGQILAPDGQPLKGTAEVSVDRLGEAVPQLLVTTPDGLFHAILKAGCYRISIGGVPTVPEEVTVGACDVTEEDFRVAESAEQAS